MNIEDQAIQLYMEGLSIEQVIDFLYRDNKYSMDEGIEIKKADIKTTVYKTIYEHCKQSSL